MLAESDRDQVKNSIYGSDLKMSCPSLEPQTCCKDIYLFWEVPWMIPVLGNRNRRGVSLPHKRNPLLLCLPRIPMIQVSFDLLKPLRLLFTDSLNNIRLALVTGGQWELSILNALQKRATGPCLFSNSMPIMQINCHGCVAKGPITELELIPYVIFI